MKTQESEFNETQALKVVDEMIAMARNRIDEQGFLFLLWGWIVVVGNLLGYLWYTMERYELIGMSWGALSIVGFAATIIYIVKREKQRQVRTYLDNFMAYLWGAFIISLLIFQVFLVSQKEFELISPAILIIAGLATFTTGGAIKFRPLIAGGVVFWVFSAVTFLVQSDLQFLISAVAMIGGYLIPGYMLRTKFKKQNV